MSTADASAETKAQATASLGRAVRLFLPISGAISLVLLPLALLYGQSRRDTLQTRLKALVDGGSLQVQQMLVQVESDTAVAAALADQRAEPRRDPTLALLFAEQVRREPRYSAVLMFNQAGEPVLQIPPGGDLQRPPCLQAALEQGMRLPPAGFWISSALWPQRPQSLGLKGRTPCLLAVRPLFSGGSRRGVLLYVTNLAALLGDFDRATNRAPQEQRGFLLSSAGEVLNPVGRSQTTNIAQRDPALWRQIQRQPRGMRRDRQGLFLYERLPGQQGLTVLIQVPPGTAAERSVFNHPLGVALVSGLYLLAAALSLAIARAQERLEASRRQERQATDRLQSVLHSAGVGMGLCEADSGRFTSVNQALCRLLGRRADQLEGRSWLTVCHPNDQPAAREMLEAVLQRAAGAQHLRLRLQRPDGSSVWGDLTLAGLPGTGASNGADALILQIVDVSELVAQAAYLEAAAEAGIVGVWDWDIQRNVLTWDPVMYKLYGRRRDQFAGAYEAWASAVHPDDRAYAEGEIQAAVRGWRPYQPRFRVVWPDGSVRHLQARSRTTYDANGKALRMIGVNYDITDQVQRELEIDQQRGLLAATLEALVDPQLFLTIAGELRISEANPAAAECLGRSRNQLIGQPLAALLPAASNQQLLMGLAAVARGGEPLIVDEQPLQLAAALDPRYVDLRAVGVRDGVAVSFRDVTDRRRTSQRLAASEERFRLLAENVTDVVFLCEGGRIDWIAPGLRMALGWRPEHWLGLPLLQLCHPDDQGQLREQLLLVEQGDQGRLRVRMQDREGSWHWLELHLGPYRKGDGQQRGVVGALQVVDREVAAEADLNRRARIDSLTGLLNRQEVLERLAWLNQRRRQGDSPLAVLFCDVDHFKEINDAHGHSGGDAVLQALAERLRLCTRSGDLVGRLGGDELLVVLQGMDNLSAAEALAAKIHRSVQTPLTLPTGTVQPTLSIGVTLLEADESMDDVVDRADQAMYEAKQHGRNRVIAFR